MYSAELSVQCDICSVTPVSVQIIFWVWGAAFCRELSTGSCLCAHVCQIATCMAQFWTGPGLVVGCSLGVLESGKRPQSWPQKCYKDAAKGTICHCDIQPRKLEDVAVTEPTGEGTVLSSAMKPLAALPSKSNHHRITPSAQQRTTNALLCWTLLFQTGCAVHL